MRKILGAWMCLALLPAALTGCAEPEPPPAAPASLRQAGTVRPDVWPVSLQGWFLGSRTVDDASQGGPLDVATIDALARSFDALPENPDYYSELLFFLNDGTRFPIANEPLAECAVHFGHSVRIEGEVDRWGRLTITKCERAEP